MKKVIILTAVIFFQIASFAGNGNDGKNKPRANAETTRISGIVVDANSNEALAGVAVKILNTGEIVYTDFDGNFSVDNMPAGQKIQLQVNYISYNSVKITDLNAAYPASTVKVSLKKTK